MVAPRRVGEMETFVWGSEPIEPLNERIGRQMLNEQIATVLSGRVRFRLGDEERVVDALASVLIPGGVPHEVEALEDSVVLDAFAPRREDWLRGDDAYLRG